MGLILFTSKIAGWAHVDICKRYHISRDTNKLCEKEKPHPEYAKLLYSTGKRHYEIKSHEVHRRDSYGL